MPDQKKNSSIFNFNSSQRKFLKYLGIFFIPIIGIAVALEILVVDLPSPFKIVGEYIEQEADDIEVAVFGSSQIKNSVNPEFLDKNTLNISSSAQHHNTDFNLLKGLVDRLPNLNTVVFEVSYGHFEIPHNSKYYWKNSVYLKYYDINTFGRPTGPADNLLFISHPGYFSNQFVDYYLRDSLPYQYNKWGFDNNFYEGKFRKLNYDIEAIEKSTVKINRGENIRTLKCNVEYFEQMLEFCYERGIKVVIISPPTFRNYNEKRDKNILRRRDSVLAVLQSKHEGLVFLNAETDPLFKVRDFRNENHLNPHGAKKFSLQLNKVLNQN